ncbi:MAG: polysaccharide biosynthesis tyrosine autokinase [Roseobacter sp.]
MNNTPKEPFAAEPENDDSPVGIVALWQLLWRNKLRILIPAFVLAFLTSLLVLRSQDTYTAEAQMLLSRGNLEIVEFDSAGGTEVSQGAITNALTILGSRSLALQVIERLDLTSDPEANPNLSLPADTAPEDFYSDTVVRQYALDWLASVTRVNILPGSNAILVRVTSTGPGKSAAIANAYLDSYLDYQIRRGQNETARAADALETRVNELRLRLEADQQKLQTFRAGAQSTVMQSTDTLTGEAANIRTRLMATEEDLLDLDIAAGVLAAADQNDVAALRQAMDANEALTRIQQTTLGRPVNASAVSQDIEAVKAVVQAERARLMQLSDALKSGLTALEARIAEINAYTVGVRQLEVEIGTTSQVYETSLARLKELSIQTGLRDAGAQILARAEAPLRTDAQGRRRMVAIAGILGLFIGIAYVLIREAANDRVRKSSELADIAGTDTIVQLPPSQYGLLDPKNGVSQAEIDNKSMPFLEGIRALRHRLTTNNHTGRAPLIAGVFSSLPSDGRPNITASLANSFSLIDRRVIVVDADMRASSLSRKLGCTQTDPGLQNVISEKLDPSEAIVTKKEFGFDFLPSGFSSANPADLLEADRFAELVVALGERYDIVLFDTPPILILSDASKIAMHMDAHILTADYDHCPRSAVRDSVEALSSADVNPPVVVLANAPKALGKKYGVSQQAYAKFGT